MLRVAPERGLRALEESTMLLASLRNYSKIHAITFCAVAAEFSPWPENTLYQPIKCRALSLPEPEDIVLVSQHPEDKGNHIPSILGTAPVCRFEGKATRLLDPLKWQETGRSQRSPEQSFSFPGSFLLAFRFYYLSCAFCPQLSHKILNFLGAGRAF